VKVRPVISYFDLPFGGVEMTVLWKKHRLVCPNVCCPETSYTLPDHRIAGGGCMHTTRAAKWVVKQIGAVQTISRLARSSAAGTSSTRRC